ncbi:MAG: AtpZ/AtpI family protein [Pirellulaceae bacterium]
MPPDDRAPLARAYQRATRGITVAMGMVIPGLAGYFLDLQLGTRAVLTILGFGLGVTFGIWELVRMTRPPRDENGGT